MGFLTAIFGVLSAVFSAVASAAAWIFKTMPPLGWVLLAVLLIGLYLGHGCTGVPGGCTCRDFFCRRTPRPPRPERTHTVSGKVVSVEATNRFTIQDGRRQRPVTIRWVVVTDAVAGQALTAQLLLVGSSVSIEALGGRIMGDAETQPGLRRQEGEAESEQPTAETTDSPGQEEELAEGRGPIVGTVQNANGQDVGLSLVTAGLATCQDDAPSNYKAAEAANHK